MRNIIAPCLGLLLIQRLSAEPELKGSAGELAAYLAAVPRTVAVTGESEVKVQADRAVISLKATTENRSLQDALRLNQEIRNKIINSLTDSGLAPDRVQASKFSSTPKYGIFKEKAKSYRVENILKITVREEKEFQAAARLVDGFAEVEYLGIDFEHSDKEALKKKAVAQALDDAFDHAKVYEQRLAVRLVPKGFSEAARISQGAPPSLPQQFESKILLGRSAKAPTPIPAQNDFASVAEERGSLFGELFFNARVAVEYSVESK